MPFQEFVQAYDIDAGAIRLRRGCKGKNNSLFPIAQGQAPHVVVHSAWIDLSFQNSGICLLDKRWSIKAQQVVDVHCRLICPIF